MTRKSSAKRPLPAERLGGVEQLAEIEHAQQPGALERRLVNRIGARQRTAMGCRGPRALRMAADLDHHDGLGARGSARRRHELARLLDPLDIEQDRPGVVVGGEEIEQVAKVDVELVADRHHGGEADPPVHRPLDHAGRDRARLRDQRQIARQRHVHREARIEPSAGRHDAEAVGTDQAETVSARCLFGGLGKRSRAVAETRRDDDGGCGAVAACRLHDAGHHRRRHRDDDQVGRR